VDSFLPKRNCYQQSSAEKQGSAPGTQVETPQNPEALRLAELQLRIQDQTFIAVIVEQIRKDPGQLNEEQRMAIRALLTTVMAERRPKRGMSFEAWAAEIVNPQLRQIIDVAREKNISLLELSGVSWNEVRRDARSMSEIGQGIVDSVTGTGKKAAAAFNNWAQENPALAVAALLGGAYACSKIIAKVVGEGYISKGLHLAGGTILAGKILQLEGVKDLIYRRLGVRVSDWRLGRALQELGSLEFTRALKEILGADPSETTTGELEHHLYNLDQWMIQEDGMADIVFGRQNFEHGLRTRIIPILQNMNPPRIAQGKTLETLTREERLFVIRYALDHSGQIAQIPGNPTGKKFEEVRNREFIDDIDAMLGELEKAKSAMQEKSGEDILTFMVNEIEGMTKFGEFIGTLDAQTRREVGNQMKQQMLGNFEGFFQVKTIFESWKRGDPQYESLPTAIAGQLLSLKEVFGQYVGNVREAQSEHLKENLWKWIVAVVAITIVANGGIAVMRVGASMAIRLVFRVGIWGLRGLASLGPWGIPVAIVIAAAAYTGWRYFDSGQERERRRGRNPEDWISFAQSQVLNEEDYIPKLYELAYLHIDDIAWTSNAAINEFFGAEFGGSERIELVQCREFILKAAVMAQLRTPGFVQGFPTARISEYQSRAFGFLDQQYRTQHYTPTRREEAAEWVRKALRYASLLDQHTPTDALRLVNENTQTAPERERMEGLRRESRENPVNPFEASLNNLTSIDRRASLSLAFDLYQLKEIASDRTLIPRVPGYETARVPQYEEDFRLAQDHLRMAGAEGGMETRMLQGSYTQLRGMIEHSDLVSNPENRWSTMANAEVARLSTVMQLYHQYPTDRELLGIASHASQTLKKMQFENAPAVANGRYAPGRRVRAPIDAGRLNDRVAWYLESMQTVWTVAPEFFERIQTLQDRGLKISLTYSFFQCLIAQQSGANADRSLTKARQLMEQILTQTTPLPNMETKKDHFEPSELTALSQYASRHFRALSGTETNVSLSKGPAGEIQVIAAGHQHTISYHRERNLYHMRHMTFDPSSHGLLQAIIAAARLMAFCKPL